MPAAPHRHIPGQDIRSLGDISFAPALEQALRPSDQYDSETWLFVPNTYTEYRYILGTRGQNPLVCIGINPSTARPGQLDPTLKSVQRTALRTGHDSFIMFNVYAQRATLPQDLDAQLNPALHRQNMLAFRYVLSLHPGADLWAAWGTLIKKRAYLPACLEEMIQLGEAFHARWLQCGPASREGHPHHPLYLRNDAPLEPFDVKGYLARLRPEGQEPPHASRAL